GSPQHLSNIAWAASQLGPQHFHDCLTAVVKETSRRISEFDSPSIMMLSDSLYEAKYGVDREEPLLSVLRSHVMKMGSELFQIFTSGLPRRRGIAAPQESTLGDVAFAAGILKDCFGRGGDFTVVVEAPEGGDSCGSEVRRVEFKVWSQLLARWSAVFDKMINSEGFVEGQTARVVITDFSKEAVGIFLRFLYSGEVEGPLETLVELCSLADKDWRRLALEEIWINAEDVLKECPNISPVLLEEILAPGLICMKRKAGEEEALPWPLQPVIERHLERLSDERKSKIEAKTLLPLNRYEHTTTLFQDLQLRQGRSWEVAEAMAMPGWTTNARRTTVARRYSLEIGGRRLEDPGTIFTSAFASAQEDQAADFIVVWLGQGKADSPTVGRAGRSGDAECRAMLATHEMLKKLIQEEGREDISGSLAFHTSGVPCLSCVGIAAQFKRCYPRVNFCFTFQNRPLSETDDGMADSVGMGAPNPQSMAPKTPRLGTRNVAPAGGGVPASGHGINGGNGTSESPNLLGGAATGMGGGGGCGSWADYRPLSTRS
ncbi:unnamed protein product, partial [Symbiodinium microadriaticum]